MMKRLLFASALLLPSLAVSAYDFEINGVFFNIIDTNTPRLEVVQGANYSGIILLPETVTYKGVTYIVTSIGENAFFNCTDLQYIEFPSSITTIGNNAFYGCKSLEEISLPLSLTSLGSGAFRDCLELKTVSINPFLAEIPEWSFSYCESLQELEIPDQVRTIAGQAFFGCKSLSRVSLGEKMSSISSNAFGNCESLKVIESYAMTPPEASSQSFDAHTYQTADLKVPYFSDGIYQKTYPWNLFNNIYEVLNPPSSFFAVNGIQYGILDDAGYPAVQVMENLDKPYSGSVKIPENVEYLGETYKVISIATSAFQDNFSVSSIEMANSILNIGDYAFSGCDGLNSIKLSTALTDLPAGCFQSCLSLSAFTIPNNIKSIGERCFLGCFNLASITIGTSIESIATGAFIGCPAITEIYSLAETPPVAESDIFEPDVYNGSILNVKHDSLNDYKETYPWSGFKNIRQFDYTPISTISMYDDEYYVNVGAKFKPDIRVTPSNYTKSDLGWSSNDPSIASVAQDGTITANKAGIAFVAAYSIENPEISVDCMVVVTDNGNSVKTLEQQGILISVRNHSLFIDGKPDDVVCRIYNMSGSLVKETFENSISGITPGIYIIRIGAAASRIIL